LISTEKSQQPAAAERPIDVKDILGHEDVNITLRHYGNWVKAGSADALPGKDLGHRIA
jgi:hypothetical protein